MKELIVRLGQVYNGELVDESALAQAREIVRFADTENVRLTGDIREIMELVALIDTPEEIKEDAPIKLWIANLGKYNEGELVGEWLALPYTEQELNRVLTRIGIGVNYEEYAIFDAETQITGLSIGQWDNIKELNHVAQVWENATEWEQECFKALCEGGYVDMANLYNMDSIEDELENYCFIETETMINENEELAYAVVEQLYGDVSQVPNKEFYFDVESFGRDLSFDMELLTEDMDEEEKEKIENMSDYELGDWYIDSLGSIDCLGEETINNHFDYEQYGRNLSCDGAFLASNNMAVL